MARIQENIDDLRIILSDVYDLTGICIEIEVFKQDKDHPENISYLYSIYDNSSGKQIVLARHVDYEAVLTFISGLVTGFDFIRTKLFEKISLN